MRADELLERIASTLRRDIGPAIEAEYPKTQAFMAAVVLHKLGRQLGMAEAHRAADVADLRELQADLLAALAARTRPAAVAAAVTSLARDGDAGALCQLIGVLYEHRAELGAEDFEALLGRVRRTLRASIDRRMEFAA